MQNVPEKEIMGHIADLFKQIVISFNGTGHQLGKEGNETTKGQQIFL